MPTRVPVRDFLMVLSARQDTRCVVACRVAHLRCHCRSEVAARRPISTVCITARWGSILYPCGVGQLRDSRAGASPRAKGSLQRVRLLGVVGRRAIETPRLTCASRPCDPAGVELRSFAGLTWTQTRKGRTSIAALSRTSTVTRMRMQLDLCEWRSGAE